MLRKPYLHIQRQSYRYLAQNGHPEITPSHSAVFRNIAMEGSSISDLAAKAGMTKQSMGYLVDTLSKLGYVTMCSDPSDGRAKLVFLTENGSEVVAQLRKRSRGLENRLKRKFGKDWVDDLNQKLSVLMAFLGEEE